MKSIEKQDVQDKTDRTSAFTLVGIVVYGESNLIFSPTHRAAFGGGLVWSIRGEETITPDRDEGRELRLDA